MQRGLACQTCVVAKVFFFPRWFQGGEKKAHRPTTQGDICAPPYPPVTPARSHDKFWMNRLRWRLKADVVQTLFYKPTGWLRLTMEFKVINIRGGGGGTWGIAWTNCLWFSAEETEDSGSLLGGERGPEGRSPWFFPVDHSPHQTPWYLGIQPGS